LADERVARGNKQPGNDCTGLGAAEACPRRVGHEQPGVFVDPDEAPIWKGDQGIVDCCHELGVVGVKLRTAHEAVFRREIHPTRLGNANWFSTRDVVEWLKSRKQPGHYRARPVVSQPAK
jgi:hypothetical protein